jgi:mRNA interferase HigB
MHIISRRTLREFWEIHPESASALLRWHTTLQHTHAADFAALKTAFNAVDWVSGYVVFDVGGNKYRIITDIVFRSQTAYIKHVFTHKEYDKWQP